jgi:membrane-bound metal-dependent hydrolase YbcI (DUF457 family)
MPLPVGHSLIGATVGVLADRDGARISPGRLLAAVVLANAPDFDYLPGVLLGDPHRFHRMAVHSLGWALLVGALAALWVKFGRRDPWPVHSRWRSGAATTGIVVAALWASHIALDSLNADFSEPVGQMIFWPLSTGWYSAVPVFMNIDKVAGPATPWGFALSLLTLHNLQAVALEAVAIGPLLLLALWLRRHPAA